MAGFSGCCLETSFHCPVNFSINLFLTTIRKLITLEKRVESIVSFRELSRVDVATPQPLIHCRVIIAHCHDSRVEPEEEVFLFFLEGIAFWDKRKLAREKTKLAYLLKNNV
jgi:hypothetical protein